MEGHTRLLDRKNQYYQNDYTTEGNLQIQCNPYQITKNIFHKFLEEYGLPRLNKGKIEKMNEQSQVLKLKQ